jgi:hypothetical protein
MCNMACSDHRLGLEKFDLENKMNGKLQKWIHEHV